MHRQEAGWAFADFVMFIAACITKLIRTSNFILLYFRLLVPTPVYWPPCNESEYIQPVFLHPSGDKSARQSEMSAFVSFKR